MAVTDTLAWRTPAPLWRRALASGSPTGAGTGAAAPAGQNGLVPASFTAPVLLRYAGDAFMEDLQAVLDRDPAGLADQVVRAETWRSPAAGWSDAPGETSAPITLFQPVQSRFYLAAASLVCERPGLPDRAVRPRDRERAGFLMRRLVPKTGSLLDPTDPDTFDEHGWFGDRREGLWLPLDDPAAVHPDEERLPLFPVAYPDGTRTRRLWAGLIPVGFRETYEAGARKSLRAPAEQPAPALLLADPLGDPRVAEFSATLIEAMASFAALPDDPQPAGRDALIRDSLVHASLDLGLFLERELPALWAATGPGGLGTAEALYQRLAADVADSRSWLDLAHNAREHETEILTGDTEAPGILITAAPAAFTPGAIRTAAETLLGALDTSPSPAYALVEDLGTALGDPRADAAASLTDGWTARLADWPTADAEALALALTLLLELADWLAREIPTLWAAIEADSPAGLTAAELVLFNRLGSFVMAGIAGRALLRDAADRRREILLGDPTQAIPLVVANPSAASLKSGLTGLVAGGLAAALTAALPVGGPPPLASDTEGPGDTVYVLRCVLDRPACPGIRPSLVSAPSRPFRLASFFDPDAPTRRLELRLPVDTSLAGLRRFPKGVSVLISNQLRAQMERIAQIKVSDDGSVDVVGSDKGFDLGLICSFSIPIITICAMILLMIVVQLLNIVFFWLPYFVICLPLGLGSRS